RVGPGICSCKRTAARRRSRYGVGLAVENHVRRSLAITCIFFVQGGATGRTATMDVRGEIFNQAQRRVPAFAAALVPGGSLTFAAAADGDKPHVSDRTLFRAYSVAKPITALAVLRLAHRREVDLD